MPQSAIKDIEEGRRNEMCDFTHMGILQFRRDFTADIVEPFCPENERIRALEQTNACAVIATTLAVGLAGNKALADAIVERAPKIAN